ncbi:MAG TPA: GNAT family protein [Thermomicrobiales bacterium]|nr:GNAT family protein [Thermomicrobiales bacterium]
MTGTIEKTNETPVPGTGYLEQTFLVGEQVYLRPIEEPDAAWTVSLRDTIFPISVKYTEEWIKETVTKQEPYKEVTLAIVRKSDDRIVGSLQAHYADVAAWISARVDPLFGDRAPVWKAEAIVLAAKWLVDEMHAATAHIELPVDEDVLVRTLTEAGFRETARWREWYFRKGNRVDRVALCYLNQGWVKTLGDPNDVELPRTGTGEARPVPVKVEIAGDHPDNAMMIGKRVYLRPPTRADVEEVVRYARRETETFFDIGRHLPDVEGFAKWTEESQKEKFPRWVRFAVCLRDNDEIIGEVGLFSVDLVNRTAESASFFYRPEYRGGGYGSEAKQLMLEYGFNKLGLHVIQSWVYFQNTRSAAALRKQGYREAGRVNWHYMNAGTFDSFVVFDLLASEWRAMPRKDWGE